MVENNSSIPVAAASSLSAIAGGSSSSSSGLVISLTHTSHVDSKDIKLVTLYCAHPSNPNMLLKTVTKVKEKVTKMVLVRECKSVKMRIGWKKFEQAPWIPIHPMSRFKVEMMFNWKIPMLMQTCKTKISPKPLLEISMPFELKKQRKFHP